MAGMETLDTGQFITYLWLLAIPFITYFLPHHVIPNNPTDLKTFKRAFIH
jgi:hypothetical protein